MNCLMSSPLLSETLRQLSTTDNGTTNVPEGVPIRLDVTIADPTKDGWPLAVCECLAFQVSGQEYY